MSIASKTRKFSVKKGNSYQFPKRMLNQSRFRSPRTGCTRLTLTAMADPQFKSPINELLLNLKRDGHTIDAPLVELHSMQSTIKLLDQSLNEMMMTIIKLRSGS